MVSALPERGRLCSSLATSRGTIRSGQRLVRLTHLDDLAAAFQVDGDVAALDRCPADRQKQFIVGELASRFGPNSLNWISA